MPNLQIKILITVNGDQLQANAKSFETAQQELGNLERYIKKTYENDQT